ncbi:MAG: fibrobacter succinogenes major paralogous domain-containing protein [Bacteroidales bacterium]|nr:fibrobacter succinogenes major paralogous domain-containing protein [Bacteroidales bacterium]
MFPIRSSVPVLVLSLLLAAACGKAPLDPSDAPQPEDKDCYALNLSAADWTSSSMLEVLDGRGRCIALVTREYLGAAIARQAVLVYALGPDGHFRTDSIFVSRITLEASGATYAAPKESIHGGTLRYFSGENAYYYNDISETDKLPSDVVYIKVRPDGSSSVVLHANTKSRTMLSPLCLELDSYRYPLVKIGGSVWTRENLRCRKYPDGTAIPKSTPSLSDAAGMLYDIPSVWGKDSSSANENVEAKIAPEGWTVPAALAGGEWEALSHFAGEASALKASSHNVTGFTAVPAGRVSSSGSIYEPQDDDIIFWSSTNNSAGKACFAKVFHKTPGENIQYSSATDKKTSFAVRLVKGFNK